MVLGKRTVRQSEIPHLETIGQLIAKRDHLLITTRTEGVASIIAKAYAAAGGDVVYLGPDDYEHWASSGRVIAFTDTKYQEHLDKTAPDWRDLDWIIIHNPKATAEAAAYLTALVDDYLAHKPPA